jgi:hypothetical protein
MKSLVRLKFVVHLCTITFLLFGIQSDVNANTLDKVIRVIKGVAWAAVSTGIDEAGNRLLGPTIWRIVKSIGKPAFDELIPKNDKQPREVVTRVVYSLDNDPVLRQKVEQRYDALPRSARNSLLSKIEEIEDHLLRIERLVIDTNLRVKELERLLLSVLNTPSVISMPKTASLSEMRRFDVNDSLLSIYYPRDLNPPRKRGQEWLVGAQIERGIWRAMLDSQQPFMIFRVIGAAAHDRSAVAFEKFGYDMIEHLRTEIDCNKDDLHFLIKELSEEGGLFVCKCDFSWPDPNAYIAVRIFHSNGAIIFIRAFAGGDDLWIEYESSLLDSMRLTKFRGACGFYETPCCTASGDLQCGLGLTCSNRLCVPD